MKKLAILGTVIFTLFASCEKEVPVEPDTVDVVIEEGEDLDQAAVAEVSEVGTSGTDSPFVMYMATSGSDQNSGLAPSEPLKTISAVQSKLVAYKPVLEQDVEVRIAFNPNQSYSGQAVNWTHTSTEFSIRFMPSDYTVGDHVTDIAGRPVFDGSGTQEWFFDLTSNNGASNIEFYYIRIQEYYLGGIRFKGSKTNNQNWNGYNKVYGCYFYKIGNKAYPNQHYGYAAIDFVNSDYNWIRNNHFVKAENKSGSDASHMHGVYLAHNSSQNTIEYNRFVTISGDPVRVRDFSNYNTFEQNVIEQSGKYAYYSTYRNTEVGECLSWENEFRHNDITCGYNGQEINLFRYFVRYNGNGALDDGPQYPSGGCQPYSNWLYTSWNVRDCQ